MLLDFFANVLDNGTERTLSQSLDDAGCGQWSVPDGASCVW